MGNWKGPKGKVCIVTGGRDFTDQRLVAKTLAAFAPDCVVHGGASGADALAEEWAVANGVSTHVFDAEWERFGKSAGPRRNSQMLGEYPNATVIVFPGGVGTHDCKTKAHNRGMTVIDLSGSPASATGEQK